MMQGTWPRNQRPVKLVTGVRGAAVRHIMTSDTAMLQTNRFMPVCSLGVLDNWRAKLITDCVNIVVCDETDGSFTQVHYETLSSLTFLRKEYQKALPCGIKRESQSKSGSIHVLR